MEGGSGSPRSQRVEENRIRILRLVGVILVEEMIGGMRLLHQAGQLRAKNVYLTVVKNLHSGQISGLMETSDLVIGELEFSPFLQVFRLLEKVSDRCMCFRKVHRH